MTRPFEKAAAKRRAERAANKDTQRANRLTSGTPVDLSDPLGEAHRGIAEVHAALRRTVHGESPVATAAALGSAEQSPDAEPATPARVTPRPAISASGASVAAPATSPAPVAAIPRPAPSQVQYVPTRLPQITQQQIPLHIPMTPPGISLDQPSAEMPRHVSTPAQQSASATVEPKTRIPLRIPMTVPGVTLPQTSAKPASAEAKSEEAKPASEETPSSGTPTSTPTEDDSHAAVASPPVTNAGPSGTGGAPEEHEDDEDESESDEDTENEGKHASGGGVITRTLKKIVGEIPEAEAAEGGEALGLLGLL